MWRTMLKSKIHRATVTQADLQYVGSITVDAELMKQANLLPGEQVQVVDIDNGARLETYVIEGPGGSGVIGTNGAAARLVHPGDLIIIMSYASFEDAEARAYRPRVVHVDAGNHVVRIGTDPAEPVPGTATARGDAVAADNLLQAVHFKDLNKRPARRWGVPLFSRVLLRCGTAPLTPG